MEGPYMVYNAQNNYYYLFVSYGSLKSDYNIRVGRSRSICGPFIDFHGKDLIADEDEDNSKDYSPCVDINGMKAGIYGSRR